MVIGACYQLLWEARSSNSKKFAWKKFHIIHIYYLALRLSFQSRALYCTCTPALWEVYCCLFWLPKSKFGLHLLLHTCLPQQWQPSLSLPFAFGVGGICIHRCTQIFQISNPKYGICPPSLYIVILPFSSLIILLSGWLFNDGKWHRVLSFNRKFCE